MARIFSGVTGALWVAPSVVGFDAAFAGSSCAQKDTLNWTPYSGLTFSSKTYPAIRSFPALTVSHLAISTVATAAAASTVSNGNVNVTMTTCTSFKLSFRSATPIGTSQRIGLGNLTWCR